ncbi:MAG: hypothetical protein RLZZ593_993 [Bacteroidota bacterium]|jgi:tetratricopeptide (TPR) repeat protein
MKKSFLMLAALGVSTLAFAQKEEIKTAQKALKAGDAATAISTLEGASSTVASTDPKTALTFYQTLADAYYAKAKSDEQGDFDAAIEAYNKLAETDKASGKPKLTEAIAEKMAMISVDLVNAAVKDNEAGNYAVSAGKLYKSYTLSPKDTIYLYYAASAAVSGTDYDAALKYYHILKDINYDGSETRYSARDKETGERVDMPQSQRDLMVKAGTYDEPKDEKTPSKRSEIIKNIALIYTQQGNDDLAMNAYVEARKNNPEDVSLILNHANLYFKLGDKETFKSLMNEAIELDPNNADLHYNIGVISMEQNDMEAARAAYQKAIDIDPNYINAYLNLSTAYVNEGNGLIEQMNSIRGSSAKEIAKYDALKEQKDGFFKKGSDVLEAALKVNVGNRDLMEQLKNIYGALGDFVNFKRLQEALEQ